MRGGSDVWRGCREESWKGRKRKGVRGERVGKMGREGGGEQKGKSEQSKYEER